MLSPNECFFSRIFFLLKLLEINITYLKVIYTVTVNFKWRILRTISAVQFYAVFCYFIFMDRNKSQNSEVLVSVSVLLTMLYNFVSPGEVGCGKTWKCGLQFWKTSRSMKTLYLTCSINLMNLTFRRLMSTIVDAPHR